jgi:serine acetyltransferase
MLVRVREDFAGFVRSTRQGPGAGLRVLLVGGFNAVLAYRLGNWLYRLRGHPAFWVAAILLGPVYVLLAAAVSFLFDITLDPSADIGPGLKIVHFGGIRVRRCRMGASCVIHHEVRLEPAANDSAGPTVGDRVWIGPHGRIVGTVNIGDGATIGAGAVVMADVSENSLALGNPARVVKGNYDNTLLRGGRN